jgi:hypothetical protein
VVQATPPDDTLSTPPLETVVEVVVPPESTVSSPPPLTTPPLLVTPEETAVLLMIEGPLRLELFALGTNNKARAEPVPATDRACEARSGFNGHANFTQVAALGPEWSFWM